MINTSISGVRQILAQYGLHPHKGLGQNFLVDKNILSKIVADSDIAATDTVLEIGTGLGALTLLLAEAAGQVVTVEIDKKLSPILEEVFNDNKNIRLIRGDFLQLDWEADLLINPEMVREQLIVCANLPYYITSPIIFNILEHGASVRHAVLMMQKEVAERLLAKPGTKQYGLLTVMVSWRADVLLVTRVSRNCFYPVPDVDSVVVKIVPLKEARVSVKDERLFVRLVRETFQKRRKTILNVLVGGGFANREAGQDLCHQLGIDPSCRGETFYVEDFARLADALFASRENKESL
ncbi:MAG: 16S rRNA (adenine(1518)-N(6)/adenine(1519)-N(6))-dimethyltransferase RsmA [Ignavibacteriales bacterium]